MMTQVIMTLMVSNGGSKFAYDQGVGQINKIVDALDS